MAFGSTRGGRPGRRSQEDAARRSANLMELLEARRMLNAAPVLDDILTPMVSAGTTVLEVPSSKPYILPLTASDADGNSLTYRVTSSNRRIRVLLHRNNPYLKLTVSSTDANSQPVQGEMVFQLLKDLSPAVVSNIMGLVNSEFYNGTTIHRIADLSGGSTTPAYIVQGGQDAASKASYNYTFDDQFNLGAIFSGKGQLAMAKPTGDDNNGTQYFITQAPQRHLDFNHTIFGQMVRGWQILDDLITKVPRAVGQDAPTNTITVTKAEIISDPTDGVMTVWAPKGVQGRVTVRAIDPSGASSVKTFVVRGVADAVKDPPFLQHVPDMVVPVNKPIKIRLRHADVDGGYVTFGASFTDSVRHAEGQIKGNIITLWPYRNYVGPIGLQVSVQQYQGNSSQVDTETFTISVGDQPLRAVKGSLPRTINAVAGSAVKGPAAGATDIVVGTFIDPKTSSSKDDFTASIDWGDGHFSYGTLTKSGTVYTISGTNTYYSEGTFPVAVTVTDNVGGASVRIPATAVVADADLTGTSTYVVGYPDQAIADQLIGSFTDADPHGDVSDFTASINWGDGTALDTSANVKITKSGSVYNVTGTHVYTTAATFPIVLSVVDKGGQTETINSTAYIGRSNLTVGIGADATINEGSTLTRDGSFIDSDPTADTWTAQVDYGDGGGLQPLALNEDKTFSLSHLYADNGSYTIRVIVRDGTGSTGNASVTLTVNNVAPTVTSVTGDSGGVRYQPRTINFTGSDVSTADTASPGLSFKINWGDGSTEQTISAGTTTATHAFATTGTFTVSVKAVDKDNGTSAAQNFTITITDIQVQASTSTPDANDLVIGGTSGNDNIYIKLEADQQLTVNIGGTDYGPYVPTGHILVYGGDGNDLVQPDSTVVHVLEIYGGNGNDTLNGATRDDLLIGGSGNDVIDGGEGRDLIIGGGGTDSLSGGAGDDILIGGTTKHDGTPIALGAILKEWSRLDADYATRVGHVKGPTAGLNQSSDATPVLYLLTNDTTGSTVYNDYAIDTIKGNDGDDLFIASPNHIYSFAKDAPLSDKTATETLMEVS